MIRAGENPNHPQKGTIRQIEPIVKRKDIKAIKTLLKDKPRDLCLFLLGINTNLRGVDLCRISVGMVKDIKAGQDFEIKEKKTSKKQAGKARRVESKRIVANFV